jgi:phage-related protein
MWTVETLNAVVDSEVEQLPVDMRARLVRLGSIIEAVGFDGLPSDTVKHLEDKLWELRLRGKDGIARAIYVTAVRRRVVIVRVFVKKTQKTPKHELELARQRAKEVK